MQFLRTRLRLSPVALLALPVGFNLWVLRAESRVVENLNDGAVHAAMLRTAGRVYASGRIPLDVWFPFLTTGTPNFHQYQSLPHIITGIFAAVVGGDRAYSWSLYLLLSFWPIAIYVSARLLEWETRTALAAAFVSSLAASRPGLGYEWLSYTFSGFGVWTQLWGAWLLPIGLGLTWRAVDKRRNIVLAALVLSVTVAAHVMTGYFACLALGIWPLVHVERRTFLNRLARGAAVGAAALTATVWFFVPLLRDKQWAAGGSFREGFWRDSFGAKHVLGWLFRGELFDGSWMAPAHRFPVLTILVFVGLVRCVVRIRKDVRARALLAISGLAFVMFSGRPTFGFLLDRLPASNALLLHRYIFAVHLAGILLAGVGAGWLVDMLMRATTAIAPAWWPRIAVGAMAVLVGVLVLSPAWRERERMAAHSAFLITGQERYQLNDEPGRALLINVAKERGDGRIYAGMASNWGETYKVGYVRGYSSILNNDGDGIGYTLRVGSMLSDAEAYFDESNPAQLDVFGVRYLVLPDYLRPTLQAAHILQTAGGHVLWEVPSTGYVRLVDTVEQIVYPDQIHAGAIQNDFLRSDELRQGLFPTIGYLGRPAARPTASLDNPPKGTAGSVTPVEYAPTKGLFRANVTATREAAVMLKASYHGRWRVRVDGRDATKYMVAPGYPAVTVSPGQHSVEFRYIPFGGYTWLFLIGALALSALHFGFRRAGTPAE